MTYFYFSYQAACPHCETVLDIRTPLNDTPKPGWVNVCLGCGNFSIFQPDGFTMTLREALPEEIVEAMKIPGLRLLREEVFHRLDCTCQSDPLGRCVVHKPEASHGAAS
jgi:hypothetical protein